MNRFVPMSTTTFNPLQPYIPQPLMVYRGQMHDPVDFDGDGSEGCDEFGEFDEYGYIDGGLGAFGGVSGRARRRKKLIAKVKKAKAEGKTKKAKKLQYRLDKLEAKMRLKGDPGIKGAKKPAKKKPATAAEKAKAKKEAEDDDKEDSAEEAADEKHEKEDPSVADAPEVASVPDSQESEGGGMNKALLIGGVVAVGALAGFFLLRKKD